MVSLRVVIIGAVLAAGSGAAAAQTAVNAVSGKPVPLLQILTAPAQPQPATRKVTHHRPHRIHAASAKRHSVGVAERRKAATHAWMRKHRIREAARKVDAVEEKSPAATEAAPADPAREPTALVVDGHTVQIASPDDANAIDLTADTTNDSAAAPLSNTAAAPVNNTAVATVSNAPVSNPMTVAATTTDSDTASEPVAVDEAQPEETPPAGSSWAAQILAALGGAAAAASVAWFLIGSAPQRTYS